MVTETRLRLVFHCYEVDVSVWGGGGSSDLAVLAAEGVILVLVKLITLKPAEP